VSWREWPANERRDLLLRLADLVLSRMDELATIGTAENGTPASMAPLVNGVLPVEFLRYYAGWVDKLEGAVIPSFPVHSLDYTRLEPYGVIAVIIPWNGPATSIGQKVAPALAAGNCVVLKPSELAPFSSLRFAELALEAGLPPGVLNVIPGGPEAGEAMVRHPGVDKVTFTGGGGAGRKVLAAAAEHLKPVVLELGGKSANIVFADADLDAAVSTAVTVGVAALSGQACALPTRLLVESSVYDEVLEQVVDLTESIMVGDPTDEATLMGPVISQGACERILGVIERAQNEGAGKLLTGGTRLSGELAPGFFIKPTVFGDVDNRSHLARQEIFGPVLSVMRFESESEAVQLANDTPYGLAGFVFTSDVTRAHEVAAGLEAGYIGVNHFPVPGATSPFGGVKESGFGREGGEAGIKEFVRIKNVNVSLER
jgi:acyl-CoA reductase-like NAD-dependent aldehyde dehydrogenase